ncbi:hypothetical protein K0M31_005683, partial [Melipona bicolor]
MKKKRCKDPICPANQSPPRYLKITIKNDMNIFHTKFNCRFVDIVLQELQRGKKGQRLEQLYQEDAAAQLIVESTLNHL